MKILFLYSEVMGYTEALFRALGRYHGAEIQVVYWDHRKKSRFSLKNEGVLYHKRSEFDKKKLVTLLKKFKPDILYISGWMDKGYLKTAFSAKSQGIPVVSGLDTPWMGKLRQWAAALFYKSFFHRHFDYFWVPGDRQYRYAKKLGFDDEKIITNLYSADIALFSMAYLKYLPEKKNKYPKRILFVGRFAPEKGLEQLLSAFLELKNEWEIVLIGNGPLKEALAKDERIVIKDFMQPQELVNEIGRAGIFCLPSLWEPWGVVVHEFAIAGLPLLLSDACGASEAFLKEGKNGFQFRSGNEEDLKRKLQVLTTQSDEELLAMGTRSHELGSEITPRKSATALVSVLERNESERTI